MVNSHFYPDLEYIVKLLSISPYHKLFNAGEYLLEEIIPPILCAQKKTYLKNGLPVAFVTWANLSEDVLVDVTETGRRLRQSEWQSGKFPFINDLVCEGISAAEIAKDLKHNIFPNDIVCSIRRNKSGDVRRVNRWIGANCLRNNRDE